MTQCVSERLTEFYICLIRTRIKWSTVSMALFQTVFHLPGRGLHWSLDVDASWFVVVFSGHAEHRSGVRLVLKNPFGQAVKQQCKTCSEFDCKPSWGKKYRAPPHQLSKAQCHRSSLNGIHASEQLKREAFCFRYMYNDADDTCSGGYYN